MTLQVEGKIDTLTAPQLDEVIREELDGLALLYLDLKEVDYISSAGLRVLLSTQKPWICKERCGSET